MIRGIMIVGKYQKRKITKDTMMPSDYESHMRVKLFVKKKDSKVTLEKIKSKLKDWEFVTKAFEEHIKHGDYDSWNSNYESMKRDGWRQAVDWVVSLLDKIGEEDKK